MTKNEMIPVLLLVAVVLGVGAEAKHHQPGDKVLVSAKQAEELYAKGAATRPAAEQVSVDLVPAKQTAAEAKAALESAAAAAANTTKPA